MSTTPVPVPGTIEDDWTVRATDGIVGVVETVRDRAVDPVRRIARWIVFAFLAAILGIALLVLVAIALVRLEVSYIPPHTAWAAHLYTGGIFTLAGLFLWWMRTPRTTD